MNKALETSASLPDILKALADPTRLRLLKILSEAELGVGELAEVLAMAQSGISRHLGSLKGVGLVQDRKEGTSNLYSLPESPADERTSALWPLVSGWLEELPEAEADQKRLARVLSARRREAVAFFQDVAPHWDGIRAAQHGEDLRDLALLELVPRDVTVLDVGTGTGFMLLGVAPRVERFIGVDPSKAMLDKARENLALAGQLDPDLREGTMECLPVADGEVDVVLGNMVLHHAEVPGHALVEMARVLRPGGRIVLTDLARHELSWTREELADVWPGFEPESLARLLRGAGFSGVRVQRTGTCTLNRRGGKERHVVDVLLASGTKG